MSTRFLLLSIRAEDQAADDEYRAMRQFSRLGDDLVRLRLDREPLGEIDLADWRGVILGGGPYNFSDPEETKSAQQRRVEADLLGLLARIVEVDFPFLGCCYGIGALGTLLGATVDHEYSEPVGPVRVTLTEDGLADAVLAGIPERFDAFVGHKEAINGLPSSARLLASSATCPVQAFRVGENVYATQFHPELDVDGICTRIDVYRHHGYFAPEAAEALKHEMTRSNVIHPPEILRNFARRYSATPEWHNEPTRVG
jgi:GMP synthase (glutamine-hydrolysing)